MKRSAEDESEFVDLKRVDIAQLKSRIIHGDARELILKEIQPNSVALVVTSPPYPMIQMWDELFHTMDDTIDIEKQPPMEVFEKMHTQLDTVWKILFSVIIPGGIVVINIGDATRRIGDQFRLFPNGARITMRMVDIGFTVLPNIYWKKPTNKPNSFLGSGMLPPNAYVTIDCEHILIFRKGGLRKFPSNDQNRIDSAFTQAERNTWFTQVWERITGARQHNGSDRRTAAFPDEIPRRLIKMFSVKRDIILDPFAGTGTTVNVAKELDRVAIGFEIDQNIIISATKDTNN